jgi:hypothetical protein
MRPTLSAQVAARIRATSVEEIDAPNDPYE